MAQRLEHVPSDVQQRQTREMFEDPVREVPGRYDERRDQVADDCCYPDTTFSVRATRMSAQEVCVRQRFRVGHRVQHAGRLHACRPPVAYATNPPGGG